APPHSGGSTAWCRDCTGTWSTRATHAPAPHGISLAVGPLLRRLDESRGRVPLPTSSLRPSRAAAHGKSRLTDAAGRDPHAHQRGERDPSSRESDGRPSDDSAVDHITIGPDAGACAERVDSRSPITARKNAVVARLAPASLCVSTSNARLPVS